MLKLINIKRVLKIFQQILLVLLSNVSEFCHYINNKLYKSCLGQKFFFELNGCSAQQKGRSHRGSCGLVICKMAIMRS